VERGNKHEVGLTVPGCYGARKDKNRKIAKNLNKEIKAQVAKALVMTKT